MEFLILLRKRKGLFIRLGFGMDLLTGRKPYLGKSEDSGFLSLASDSDFLSFGWTHHRSGYPAIQGQLMLQCPVPMLLLSGGLMEGETLPEVK